MDLKEDLMKSLISINDLSKETILSICNRALDINKNSIQHTLSNKIISTLFFEASTRTKMSFEAAVMRAGGNILSFPSDNSSLQKGESIEDTLRMAAAYSDVIVLRHHEEGTAFRASLALNKPIINAGDGTNEHPTQTLLDIYTIFAQRGSLDGFTMTLAGDLKYSRTIHSLIYALKNFNVRIILASPQNFELPNNFKSIIKDQIILETNDLHKALDTDYFYMTRVQKERLDSNDKNFEYQEDWILTKDLMDKYAPKHCRIMHPLPRINEIHTNLDDTTYNLYFQQAENGVHVRIAILEYVLGVFPCC